ncbi:MAG: hypothetical protein IIA89_07445 [Chloroflexi bacterium]|nr:hypothetical protein [Chloroflexota bacterium]
MDEIGLLTHSIPGLLIRPVSYLDPGSGSYLLQLLIAGALGALFALRLYWSRVREFFSNIFRRSQEDKNRED